jgi:hypothetical protein
VKDINGARQLEIDATSQPGRIFLSGRGFCYEFDANAFMNAMMREMLSDVALEQQLSSPTLMNL